MKLSIDRFEELYAICEDDNQKLYEIEISMLPKNAKPGDIIDVSDNGRFFIDFQETSKRKEKIKKLQDKLFN